MNGRCSFTWFLEGMVILLGFVECLGEPLLAIQVMRMTVQKLGLRLDLSHTLEFLEADVST